MLGHSWWFLEAFQAVVGIQSRVGRMQGKHLNICALSGKLKEPKGEKVWAVQGNGAGEKGAARGDPGEAKVQFQTPGPVSCAEKLLFQMELRAGRDPKAAADSVYLLGQSSPKHWKNVWPNLGLWRSQWLSPLDT